MKIHAELEWAPGVTATIDWDEDAADIVTTDVAVTDRGILAEDPYAWNRDVTAEVEAWWARRLEAQPMPGMGGEPWAVVLGWLQYWPDVLGIPLAVVNLDLPLRSPSGVIF